MAKQTIGEFLATQRKAKGYTQQYVADFLGVSNRTLSAWETNKAYPDILTLPALAELYGVTCDEIIKGERNNSRQPADTEISEKAQNKLFKSKLAKNNTKHTALLGVGICAAIVFSFGVWFWFILETDVDMKLIWISIVSIVVGLLATAVVFTLIAVFLKSALASADIYSEQPTPAESNFILGVVFQSLRTCYILARVWLACGLLCGLAFALFYPTWDEPEITIASFLLGAFGQTAILLTILLSSYLVQRKTVKKYGSEEQVKISKYNGKLFLCCSPSVIPLIAFIIILIVFSLSGWTFSPATAYILFLGALLCVVVGITVFCIKRKKFKINL